MMAHNAKQDQDNGAYLAYHKILVHKFSYHASPFQGGGELGPNSGDCWLSSWFGSATVLGFAYCAYKRFFESFHFQRRNAFQQAWIKRPLSTSPDPNALFRLVWMNQLRLRAFVDEEGSGNSPSRTKAPRLASVLIFVRSCGTCVGVQTIPKHFAIAQRRIEWGCLSSSPEGQCLFFLFYRQHKHDAQILVRLHRAAPQSVVRLSFQDFLLVHGWATFFQKHSALDFDSVAGFLWLMGSWKHARIDWVWFASS